MRLKENVIFNIVMTNMKFILVSRQLSSVDYWSNDSIKHFQNTVISTIILDADLR
jgi:hypothetical protein